MSLVLTDRPDTTYELGVGVRHSAVGNPIVYEFQRKDFTFSQINNSAGSVQLQFNGTNIASSFTAGDAVYFKSDNGAYSFQSTVVTSTYSAPDTLVTLTTTYTVAATTGFVNTSTRLNYKVTIEVWANSGILGTLRVSPSSTGFISVDVSKVVWASIVPSIQYNYNQSVTDQSGLYKDFYIKYGRIWIGFSEALTTDSITLYAVYGAKQVGSKYDSYMNEYISYSTIISNKPKFLVRFTPRMWRGLPFNISTIFDYVVTTNFGFDLQYLNSSLGVITSSSITLPSLATRTISLSPSALLGTPESAAYVNVRSNRATQSGISNYLTIPIEDPCDQPMLISWINSLGGTSWWCFNYNQEYSFEYEDGVKVRRFVLIAENLTLEEWEGINELNSPNEKVLSPFTKLTSSVRRTSKINGADVTLYDFRDSEITIASQYDDAGRLAFTTYGPHNLSFINDDFVFLDAFYYAAPFQSDGFYLRDIVTNALIPYTAPTSFKFARRIRNSLGVVVIPTSQTTNTKQEKHTISITIELPEIQTT